MAPIIGIAEGGQQWAKYPARRAVSVPLANGFPQGSGRVHQSFSLEIPLLPHTSWTRGHSLMTVGCRPGLDMAKQL
jgi:hypothetical protein